MNKSILSDRHVIMRSTKQIEEICRDFFRNTGIKFFVFNRTHQDDYQNPINKGFCLSNHSEWTNHFFTYDYHHRISFIGVNAIGSFEGYKILYCNLFEDNIMIKNLRDYFGFDHGIIICKQYKHYCEWYTFAVDKDQPQMLFYYLNNFQELIQFILYFKHRAASIIIEAEKSSFPLPKPGKENKIINNDEASKVLFAKNNWKNKQTCLLAIDNDIIELSQREAQCLGLLKKGFSAKLIAKELSLSYRTIEGYIAQCYQKLNCHSKSELLAKLDDN